MASTCDLMSFCHKQSLLLGALNDVLHYLTVIALIFVTISVFNSQLILSIVFKPRLIKLNFKAGKYATSILETAAIFK